MPALAASIPYPKASYAVLSAFSRLVEVDLDLEELEEYGQIISQKLTTGLDKLKEVLQGSPDESGEPEFEPDGDDPGDDAPSFGPEERRRIEAMFDQAALDPAKAFELKRELDRLGVFKEYENRFLDLFRKKP